MFINTVLIACDMKAHARPEHPAPPPDDRPAQTMTRQTARKSIQHKLRSGDAAHRTHTLSPRLFSPESNEIPKARSFDVIFWVATLAQNSTRAQPICRVRRLRCCSLQSRRPTPGHADLRVMPKSRLTVRTADAFTGVISVQARRLLQRYK